MKILPAVFFFIPLLLICLLGMLAALLGIGPLDRWCAAQLNDN